MDKLEVTPEQQLAFDGFIDVMVQIYKMTSDKIDYSKAGKYNDLQERLENAYVKITELEDVVAQYQEEIESIRREKISADNVYNYLILFHDAYDQLPDIMEEKVLPELHSGDSVIPGTAGNGRLLSD